MSGSPPAGGRVLRHQPSRSNFTPRQSQYSPETKHGGGSSLSSSGTPQPTVTGTSAATSTPITVGQNLQSVGIGNGTGLNPNPGPPIPPQLIPPMALSVFTPQNAPHTFQSPVYQRLIQPNQNIGIGARGVDWMTRISMALQSGIESEINWALTALLEVSFRQPDMLQFKNNSALAILLFDRIARSYVFNSDISSEGNPAGDVSEADDVGTDGKDTSLSRSKRSSSEVIDNTTPISSPFYGLPDFEFQQLQKTLECLLILRNASLDPENAHFLANSFFSNEIILKGLNMAAASSSTTNPNPSIAELQSYCIDIAESISFHMTPDSSDNPLFIAVNKIIETSTDRSTLIPTLRCLARLVIRDDKNIVGTVPRSVVDRIMKFLLVIEDEELMAASLDFLYQYTARRGNISKLISVSEKNPNHVINREISTTHLSRLLTYKVPPPPKPDYIRLPRRTKKIPPTEPPKLEESVLKELLALEEPDRATHWIRTCYEDEPEGEVTQISLWKAYEAQFESYARAVGGHRLLPAVDFIKNVTSAFRTSAAMVVNLPDGQKKFIIKGIRPREFAIPPSVLNAPPAPKKPEYQNMIPREPSAVSVSSALVLQNIARSEQGKALLGYRVDQYIEAALLNPPLCGYIDGLLDILSKPTDHDVDDDEQK